MVKTEMFQVRMTPDEKKLVARLASLYGMNESEFVRQAFAYFDTHKPTLIIAAGNHAPATE